MRLMRIMYPAMFLFFSCTGQQPSSAYAPEAGSYNGYILSLQATMTYGYTLGQGYGVMPTTTTNLMPSVLGDMIIKSKGNNTGSYSFTRATEMKGDWTYDEKTNQLTCTGALKDKVVSYHAGKGFYTMEVKFPTSDGKSTSYTYQKKATKEFPKIAAPNGAITGSLTIKPDLKSMAILDAATSKIKTSFNTGVGASNSNHYTIGVAYTNDPHNYEIRIFDPQGNAKVFLPEEIRSFKWNFTDYKFPVLSNDQQRMGLMGQVPDRFSLEAYKPGFYAIGIFDMKGKELGYLPMDASYIKPIFMNDGRLVYSPDKGGVAVSNSNYSGSTIIYNNRINSLAVSPDGKRVAVSTGLHFFTMNIDGSNLQQIICGGEALEVDKAENSHDMAWSPDGKYLALSLRSIAKDIIVIVPLDGKPYFLLRDEYGEPYGHNGNAISWH